MKNNQDSHTNLIKRTPINKSTILRRIPVALILIYYIWILVFAWSMSSSWQWDSEQGLMWSSTPPGQFFPIPRLPGPFQAFSTAYLHDQIFYIIFMHNGLWIVWLFLGFLVLSPYRINMHMLFISIKDKLRSRGNA